MGGPPAGAQEPQGQSLWEEQGEQSRPWLPAVRFVDSCPLPDTVAPAGAKWPDSLPSRAKLKAESSQVLAAETQEGK